MPSGAKKRKAAKKKKETGAPNNNNPGDDEVKSPDSDGEEFSTPAVDFHQTVFETSEFSTPGVDFHQTPFQVGGGEGAAEGKTKGGMEHVKSSKRSHDKNHNSSSSSSSDDESRADEKQGKGAASFSDLVSKEMDKLGDFGGNALVSDVVKPVVSVSVGVTRVKEYAPIESSATSDSIRPVLKENGENLLAKFNELTSASPAEVGSQTNKNSEASSNTVKFAPKDSEGKTVSSSENEPLLSVAPRPVQTTSWKSCCGLFEVFTGSSR